MYQNDGQNWMDEREIKSDRLAHAYRSTPKVCTVDTENGFYVWYMCRKLEWLLECFNFAEAYKSGIIWMAAETNERQRKRRRLTHKNKKYGQRDWHTSTQNTNSKNIRNSPYNKALRDELDWIGLDDNECCATKNAMNRFRVKVIANQISIPIRNQAK